MSVNSDAGAFLHEGGDLGLIAGLQHRGLGADGRAVALQTGLRVCGRQNDGDGQLDRQGGAVALGNDNVLTLHHEAAGIAHGFDRNVDLLVSELIHGDVVGAIPVQIHHVVTVDGRNFDLQACVEGLVDDFAGRDVPNLDVHEGRTLTGFHVLELSNPLGLVVDHHNQAILQIIGCCHRGTSLERESVVRGQSTRACDQIRDFLRSAVTRIRCCISHRGVYLARSLHELGQHGTGRTQTNRARSAKTFLA